jgi:AcrR family transcriptional regulator
MFLVLTKEQILETAEAVLRRHGPAKATVLDVAAALGVSHGSIYRFFPSKSDLRDAVVQRWLARISDALAPVTDLRTWFQRMHQLKTAQLRDEPELFEAYRVLAGEARDVLAAYKTDLARQIAAILQRGIDAGEFAPADPERTARTLMAATAAFHHPSQAHLWNQPGIEEQFNDLWQLLLLGLRTRPLS